jgi:hypothetical protein
MNKTLYKVTFLNHGKIYELYAGRVASGSLWGFTEVADLQFDVHDRGTPARRVRRHQGAAPADAEHRPHRGSREEGPVRDPRRRQRREGGHAVPDAGEAALTSLER